MGSWGGTFRFCTAGGVILINESTLHPTLGQRVPTREKHVREKSWAGMAGGKEN